MPNNFINIGIIVSIVTEILKFIPWLAQTNTRKRVTAFLVALVATIILSPKQFSPNFDYVEFLLGTLVVAYGVYKTILKQITESLGLAKYLKED